MNNEKNKITKGIVFLVCIILLIFISLNNPFKLENKNFDEKAEEIKDITYLISSVEGNIANAVVVFNSENGISKVSYKNHEEKDFTIEGNGKNKVALDYIMEDRKTYTFQVEYIEGEPKELKIDFEIPRIQGVYTLHNGVYANEPDISGYLPDKTRYLYLNEAGNLQMGNWVNYDAPSNWYDYNNQNWANIYVENEGLESYYVWIPRYCYKQDLEKSVNGNERVDIKFINVYNEYINATTGEKLTWSQLEEQGYQIPEAFSWGVQFDEHVLENNLTSIIPGY